jgi:uncharacterized protein (DUF1501 family)
MHRRDFLRTSLVGGSLVALGATAPGFLQRAAHAAPPSDKPGGKDTILVVIQLTGGNDGLNTVVPFKDPEYAKLRPTLKLNPTQLKKVNDDIGLHPSLDGLAGLLEDKSLCIVQGVGYPNPTQSHFRSMDIWQAASMAEQLNEGWIGRALKGINKPAFHVAFNNESAPLALNGAPAKVPSIASLDEFQLRTTAASGSDKKDQKDIIEGSVKSGSGSSPLLDYVSKTAANTYASAQRLQEIGKNYEPKVPYPQGNPLADRLRLAAQLIDADLGARIFYLTIDGWDTHANQLTDHARLLGLLSSAMTAFYKDMSARGHKDRLMLMTFSEFGRRPKQAGSGTDHGTAAPMMLVGGKVNAGLVGKHPSLTDLDFANLKFSIDFRQVYATILDKWLGVASKDVLGGAFEHVELFPG